MERTKEGGPGAPGDLRLIAQRVRAHVGTFVRSYVQIIKKKDSKGFYSPATVLVYIIK